MFAGLTENIGNEIGSTVDDEVLFHELRNRRNKAIQLDDTADFREIAIQSGLDLCENVDGAKFGRALGACRGEPVLLFMHHPPLPTGIEAMDACSLLEGGDELAALVRAHGAVQGILCGHLHRPVQMQFGGAPLHVAPSVSHQIRLDLRPGAPLLAQLEPPKVSLHRWTPAHGLCTHSSYVQDFGQGVPL